jgi:hypothetical protein
MHFKNKSGLILTIPRKNILVAGNRDLRCGLAFSKWIYDDRLDEDYIIFYTTEDDTYTKRHKVIIRSSKDDLRKIHNYILSQSSYLDRVDSIEMFKIISFETDKIKKRLINDGSSEQKSRTDKET